MQTEWSLADWDITVNWFNCIAFQAFQTFLSFLLKIPTISIAIHSALKFIFPIQHKYISMHLSEILVLYSYGFSDSLMWLLIIIPRTDREIHEDVWFEYIWCLLMHRQNVKYLSALWTSRVIPVANYHCSSWQAKLVQAASSDVAMYTVWTHLLPICRKHRLHSYVTKYVHTHILVSIPVKVYKCRHMHVYMYIHI